MIERAVRSWIVAQFKKPHGVFGQRRSIPATSSLDDLQAQLEDMRKLNATLGQHAATDEVLG